jgi:hypothetical protein
MHRERVCTSEESRSALDKRRYGNSVGEVERVSNDFDTKDMISVYYNACFETLNHPNPVRDEKGARRAKKGCYCTLVDLTWWTT